MPSSAARSIAVIGAGIAGLAAARTLSDAGHEVTVLESSDRVGGRVASDRIATPHGTCTVECTLFQDVFPGQVNNVSVELAKPSVALRLSAESPRATFSA